MRLRQAAALQKSCRENPNLFTLIYSQFML